MEDSSDTWGKNSKHIAASIGMFPPIPKPQKAVSTRIPLYVDGAPRQRPKIEEIKQVRLKAY